MTEKKTVNKSGYVPKTLIKRRKPKGKRGPKKKLKRSNSHAPPTLEDLLEADRQMNDLTAAGHKENGESLKLVMISGQELKKAGYRLAVGGDFRRGRYYTVRDEQGFFTLDGASLFCLKGKQGRQKLQELIDKGFFDSPRLEHKDKL